MGSPAHSAYSILTPLPPHYHHHPLFRQQWTGNLAISISFLQLSKLISEAYTFWIYAVIAILGWLFIYVFLPETQGVPLEKIERLFVGPAVPRGGSKQRHVQNSSS